MNKIQRVSLFFRLLFTIAFFAWPILTIAAWVSGVKGFLVIPYLIYFNVIPPEYPVMHALTFNERMLGFLHSMLPVVVEMWMLYLLTRLFRLYEQGEIFTLENVKYIRCIGYALIIDQFARLISEGLMGLIITLNNPHGYRFAKITFTNVSAGMLLMACLIILISWIMAEGCKLREEQQLTV